MGKMKIFVDHIPMHDLMGLWLSDTINDEIYVIEPIEMSLRRVERGESMPPTIKLDPISMSHLLQAFADACGKQGIRPAKEGDIKSEMKAVRDHLGDIKKILWHTLKIKE